VNSKKCNDRYYKESKKSIIEWVKELHQQGECLNNRYIKRKYPKRHGRACYLFGNWRKTVEAAGFNYDKDIRWDVGWDSYKVIEEIKKRHKKGRLLNPSLNKDLIVPSRRCIGSYQEAVRLAGLSYQKLGIRVIGKWSDKEKVGQQLWKRFKQGKPLNAAYMANHSSTSGLYKYACWHYGSYRKALEVNGINPNLVFQTSNIEEWINSLTAEDMRRIERQVFSINRKEDENG